MTTSALSRRDAHLGALIALPIALFLWVLPFHAVVISFSFGVLKVGMGATTIMASWKEGVAVVLFTVVMVRAVMSRGPGVSIIAPDVAISGLIALALVFAIVEDSIFAADIPHKVEVFGLRSSVFFLVLYYIGRAVPEIGDRSTYVKHLFRVAILVALIGVLERIFVTPQMLVALGAAAYMNDFLGLGVSTAGNDWGLPSNYWTWMGGVAVRRAGSVFLGGQAFAVPFLLLMPAATAWVFDPFRRIRFWRAAGYSVIWLGLLVSITRTTILVCAVQVMAYFLMTRRPTRLVTAAITAVLVLLVGILVVPGLASFVGQTASFQTASSYSHVFDWRRGVTAFFEQPWGHGLGSSDQVAARFKRTPLTADNVYLNYAVDLGLLGIVGFLAVIITVGYFSWRLFKTATDPELRVVAATVFLADLGIALNGTSSSPFNSVFLGYNFFLLAGAMVTAYQRNQLSPPLAQSG